MPPEQIMPMLLHIVKEMPPEQVRIYLTQEMKMPPAEVETVMVNVYQLYHFLKTEELEQAPNEQRDHFDRRHQQQLNFFPPGHDC
jgi:hypothetical protein